MRKDLYIKCSQEHTSKDSISNWDEVRRIENLANYYSRTFRRVFNLGINDGNKERFDTATKAVDSKPPNTRFPVKDHKAVDPIKNIPDTRGICSATEGPISRLEYLSSMWIDPVVNKQRSITECKSTNHMKLSMNEVNNIPVDTDRRRIVMSLDVEKMYHVILQFGT